MLSDFGPDSKYGKVEFKGATWKAECEETLSRGDTAKIVALDGLTLKIKGID